MVTSVGMDALAELRERVDRHARRPERTKAMLPHLTYARYASVTERHASAHPPRVAMAVVLLQGQKRNVLGSLAFDCTAGDLLLTSMNVPAVGQITRASAREPYLSVGLSIQPSRVTSLLRDAPSSPLAETPPALTRSEASEDLLDAFRRYVRLLDAPGDIPVLAEAIEREIVWRILQSPHGPALHDISLAEGNLALIGRAVDVLHRRFAEPVRVADLARVAGMSEPTFNRHFRKAMAMSPLQFQKLLRLQEARSRLLSKTTSVASVSSAVGYRSPSQFSREYRRQFGMRPGDEAPRRRAG